MTIYCPMGINIYTSRYIYAVYFKKETEVTCKKI